MVELREQVMEPSPVVADLPAGTLRTLVFVTSLSLFNFGYNTASIGGALLYIDKELECTEESVCLEGSFEKGCVVSSCLLGACLGALFGGSVADRFGRRAVLLANNVFYIGGPVGMALAPGVVLLALARAVAGVGVGVSSALVHVYISEIVPAAKRGKHGAMLVMMGTGGVLMANVAAYALGRQWRWVLGLACLPALLQVAWGPAVMPESTRWLQAHERRQAVACRALVSIGLEARDLQPAAPGRSDGVWYGLWCAIRSGQARQPLLVGIGLQILQQISGINVAVYYGPKIFTLAHFSTQSSIFLSAAVSGAQIAATLVLARLIDRVGRRPMSFIGLVFMVVSLSALAAAFLVSGSGAGWLALGAVLVFRVAFSISLGPLPYIITAEVFPSSCRASGVSLCWAVNWASNFAVSMTFLPLLSVLTVSGTFFLYAGICVLAIWFVHACVPETRGQTLEQLEQLSAAGRGGVAGATGEEATA